MIINSERRHWSEETRYRFDERIAILTDGKEPTPEQIEIAMEQARAHHWLEQLQKKEPKLL